LLYKPLVINLAGLTSTGKTSLVRDLVKSLNMYEQFVEIDLSKAYEGERTGMFSGGPVSSRIHARFEDTDSKGIVLIDEFQKINNNPSYNEVWSLLSDGKLGNSHYTLTRIDSTIRMLSGFIEEFKDNAMELEYLKNTSGDNSQFNMRGWNPTTQAIPFGKKYIIDSFLDTIKITSIDSLQPLFDFHDFGLNKTGFIFGFSNMLRNEYSEGNIDIKGILSIPGYTYVTPLIEIARQYRKILVDKYNAITGRDPLVFSKLLIFTAENVDGLYTDSKNTNISADELHEKTLKLTLSELKNELLKVFKPEEVSRLGANFIIYPSLSLKAFQMIINDKITEIEADVFRITGIKINLKTKKFSEYLEDVSIVASQGARPVISRVYAEINKIVPKLVKNATLSELKTISVSSLKDFK